MASIPVSSFITASIRRDVSYQRVSPARSPSSFDIRRRWVARGSSVRYTRWPKPGTFTLRASMPRTAPSTRASSASLPIASSIRITSALAPPCSGPLRAPIPATTAECTSLSVAAVTRAAKVDAFSSWSACRTSATSNARAASADGRSPVSSNRKFAA